MRPVAGEQRALAKARRSGTSFTGGEGQRSFADGFGRKEQRLADVVSLEVGVQREDTLCGLAISHEGNDSRNGNPKTAKTRNSPHLTGIGRDPLELHVDSVARRQLVGERPSEAVPALKQGFRRMTENSHTACVTAVLPRGTRQPSRRPDSTGESLRATCRSASQLKRERLGQLPRNGMDRLPSGAV